MTYRVIYAPSFREDIDQHIDYLLDQHIVLLNQRVEFRWRVDEPFHKTQLTILRHSAGLVRFAA